MSVRVHHTDSLDKEIRYVIAKWCSNTLPSSGWQAAKRRALQKNIASNDCLDKSSSSWTTEMDAEVSESDDGTDMQT